MILLHLTANKPGELNFTASLSRNRNPTTRVDGEFYVLEAQLAFDKPGGGGVGTKIAAVLAAKATGGKMTMTSEGLKVENADAVTLYVSGGSNLYGGDPYAKAKAPLAAAMKRGADAILVDAMRDHARYMRRVSLRLPAGPNAALPTPERVMLNEEQPDPSLAALYFQFGRHLLVSGSRPDSRAAQQPARHLGG